MYSISELVNKSLVNKQYERPSEYRFVWSWLSPLLLIPKEYRRYIKILDVGGAESRLAKTLAELGFDVTVIDIKEGDFGKARFIKANVLEYEFPEESFDVILAISTVEHVGLPCYDQDIIDYRGDIVTMKKIYRWLKKGGIAIITLPFGKPHHPPWFERVYNIDTLKTRILVEPWEILDNHVVCEIYRWNDCAIHIALLSDSAMFLVLRRV